MKTQNSKSDADENVITKKQLWATIPENSQAQISGGGRDNFVRSKPHVNIGILN